ncbi:MAG TPA: DinB family protein [Pyrinomonadaceae bacterium]|jgi:hypothetical protein
MAFNSVAEIFDSIDETRLRLDQTLSGIDDRQQNFRPTPEAWTIAEIAEHLSIIEHQLVQLTTMMLRKAEAAGMLRAAEAGETPEHFSIDRFVEQSKGEKYIAPENVRPRGELPLAESLARLRNSRASLRELRPRLEQIDGASLQYPHPAFGPLNLYQWLAFVGAHEDRHLRQIQKLMQSTQYEKSSASDAAESLSARLDIEN